MKHPFCLGRGETRRCCGVAAVAAKTTASDAAKGEYMLYIRARVCGNMAFQWNHGSRKVSTVYATFWIQSRFLAR